MAFVHIDSKKTLKYIAIGKYNGKMLAILIARINRDRLAIQTNRSVVRFVEPHDQLCQSCLSAAISANDKDDFAWTERQVDRTHIKLVDRALIPIGVGHIDKFEALPPCHLQRSQFCKLSGMLCE